jgi:hypothetical protein
MGALRFGGADTALAIAYSIRAGREASAFGSMADAVSRSQAFS